MRRKKYPCQGVKVVTCLYLLANLATGQVQNMLNNGGFESGLMCYNTSVWNTTGDPFASDYQFTLSPDSHSGGYSLAISCVTPKCVKAAIASSRIPTLASQSYKLSLYAKCPAGSEGYAFIPEVASGSGYLYQKLSCTGAWTLNAVNFTVPSTATDFSFSVYNFDTRPLQVDDVLLTYSDGTVPQHPVLHPGNRSISISGPNMNVDGKPYFALGFIDVRYADIGSVAATGANTIFGFGNSGNQNCFNTAQENYLDLAYDNGLNFIPNSTSTARMGFPGIFSNVAAQFPPHKANIAWFLADEVDQYVVPLFTIPAATVVAEYQTLAPLAGVPLFENFQRAAWSVPGDDQAYSPGTDIWMAEPFGTDFTQIPHAVKLFNSIAPKPIWLAEDDIDSTMIVPKAYYGAISGATGLHYYTWDAFKSQPDKLAAVTQAFSELKQLTPAIFGANLAVTASAEIAALGRSLNGSQYILAANPFQTNVQSVFTVAGLTTGTPVQVMFENRTILASQGGFQDAFAGISRHAYLISPITSKQIPQIIWPTPAAIVSGTPLSATQLNAQSNVPGTFTYNPAAGAILAAGTQTLTASFTPTDSSTYSGVSASVNIVVTPAVVGGSLPNGEFISPNTGSLNPGTPQNFQLTWASAAGQSQIYSGNILIQDSTAPAPTSGATFANSCLIRVYSFGSAQLVDDAGVVNSSPIWFGNSWAFSPSNSHCSVDGPNSWLPTVASSTASGATLQTTVRLTINQSWAGRTLTFWLQGGNANYAVGGWQQLGTMTVIGSNPSFTMGATAAAAVAGASGSSTVTVTPANGFASPVDLCSYCH